MVSCSRVLGTIVETAEAVVNDNSASQSARVLNSEAVVSEKVLVIKMAVEPDLERLGCRGLVFV